jgi:hypothetical protein
MQHFLGYIAGIGVFGHFWTTMVSFWSVFLSQTRYISYVSGYITEFKKFLFV